MQVLFHVEPAQGAVGGDQRQRPDRRVDCRVRPLRFLSVAGRQQVDALEWANVSRLTVIFERAMRERAPSDSSGNLTSASTVSLTRGRCEKAVSGNGEWRRSRKLVV